MLSLDSVHKNKLKKLNYIRIFAFLGLLAITLSALILVNNLFVSLLLAFVISYMARPFITPLERAGLSYNMALILIFLSGFILLALISIEAVPRLAKQISHLQAEWPRYSKGLLDLIETTEIKIHNWLGIELALQEKSKVQIIHFSKIILKDLPFILLQTLTVLLLAPFLAFFILKDSQKISRGFLLFAPNSVFEMVLELQYKINKQLGQFIRARFLEAFIVGLLTYIGLSLLSVPFAIFLGMFAGIVNLIPYIGPIIGAVPAVILALINQYTALELSLVVGVYVITQLIDAGILVPILIARIVNLHPVTVVFIIILGGQFMGILGMIISIPLANAIKVSAVAIYQHITELKNMDTV